jgi:hypothetical protein
MAGAQRNGFSLTKYGVTKRTTWIEWNFGPVLSALLVTCQSDKYKATPNGRQWKHAVDIGYCDRIAVCTLTPDAILVN